MPTPGDDDPDAPLLPVSSSENELRGAVGAREVREPEVYGNVAPPPTPTEYPLYAPPAIEPSYAAPPGTGAKPPPVAHDDSDGDDEPPRKRSVRTIVLSAVGLVVALGIGTLIFLGSINSGN